MLANMAGPGRSSKKERPGLANEKELRQYQYHILTENSLGHVRYKNVDVNWSC